METFVLLVTVTIGLAREALAEECVNPRDYTVLLHYTHCMRLGFGGKEVNMVVELEMVDYFVPNWQNVDMHGHGCREYQDNTRWCGLYDSTTFDSSLCCGCAPKEKSGSSSDRYSESIGTTPQITKP